MLSVRAAVRTVAIITMWAVTRAPVRWAWELSEGSVDFLNWDSKSSSQILRERCRVRAGALGRTD